MDTNLFIEAARIANLNTEKNHGRVFTPESVAEFLASVDHVWLFYTDTNTLYGIMTVKRGELGFILDPAFVRMGIRNMKPLLSSLTSEPLVAHVQKDNRAICRLLERDGFTVIGGTDNTHTYWRHRGNS